MSTRYQITHAGPDIFDCHCLTRWEEVGGDGVRRLALTDVIEASSLSRARQGTDPRCAVVEMAAGAVERRAA